MLSTDLLDYRLGPDGDLVLTDKGFEMTSGAEGVAQLCRIATLLILGEWFLNQAKGIDWFNILQREFVASEVQATLRTTWAGVPGVVEVLAVKATVNASGRQGHVSGSVRTAFGDVEVTAAVGGSSV